jgi:hypothetical protein
MGCPDRLVTDSQTGDEKSQCAGKHKGPPQKRDAKSIIIQPLTHRKMGGRTGYDTGNQHPFVEFPDK